MLSRQFITKFLKILTFNILVVILYSWEVLEIENINDRIKLIFDYSGLTQADIGKKLKVSQAYISKLVKTGSPSPILIEDICGKFGINEEWLRFGKGDMIKAVSPDDQLASAIADIILDAEGKHPFYTLIKEMIIEFEVLEESEKEKVDQFFGNVLKKLEQKEGV